MTTPEYPQNLPVPQPKSSGRKRGLIVITCIIAVIVIGILLAALGNTSQHNPGNASGNQPVTAQPVTSEPAPVPTPDPKGTYVGSCDYTLTSDFSGNGYDHLIGEIDLHNTGNIGTVDKLRITWPQEGYPPIVAKRTVHSKPGEHLAARFHIAVPSSGNVITLLQSWQESHGMKDGCTYKVTITDTFGTVQGG